MVVIKEFSNKEDQQKWIVENQSELSAQRKSENKKSDPLTFISYAIDENGEKVKNVNDIPESATKLKVRCIINTTNLLDSHKDVHMPGLWNKSLKETRGFYLLQEHDFTFKGIISDSVKAFTKTYTWKELGYEIPGDTQALVFDTEISIDRNPYMFEQYRKGYVKNHSVGMRTIKDYLCINNETYTQEYENWEKYIDKVVNKEEAEKIGFFWAVTEAKIIEGSAVPRGSNWITPVQSAREVKTEQKEETKEKKYIYNPNII